MVYHTSISGIVAHTEPPIGAFIGALIETRIKATATLSA